MSWLLVVVDPPQAPGSLEHLVPRRAEHVLCVYMCECECVCVCVCVCALRVVDERSETKRLLSYSAEHAGYQMVHLCDVSSGSEASKKRTGLEGWGWHRSYKWCA